MRRDSPPRFGRAFFVEFFTHVLLLIAVAFALYPLLWVITLAFSPGDAPQARVFPVPLEPTLEHFSAVALRGDASGSWLFGQQLFNSLVVSASTALVSVLFATPAAYAFARFRFVGGPMAMKTLLAVQMVPAVAAAIPLYLILNQLHLLDTRGGLILVYATTALPFSIFQLRSAFQAIPRDLEEAAMVDGATRFGAFLRVALPAARPAIAVTALFSFMAAWNEFILAATFLSKEERFTLPVVLQRYVGEYSAQWGHFAAGAILVSVPVMALFYALQRQLVGGLTSGGVKG